ncbi:N(2)-fixation sustaining protein CowN [Oleispirillum naphthae]|uniref:N(2)-fixation sustaining protein CowN n=1 Tax=Oleispirillum naphthae TaxID=2838853 RepID=UPI00308243FB
MNGRGNATAAADRYVSFCNIDCDGMAARLLPLALARLAAGDCLANPFWRRFADAARALAEGAGEGPDALYLVCSHVMYLAEIFEDDAGEGRMLLEEIELQCC